MQYYLTLALRVGMPIHLLSFHNFIGRSKSETEDTVSTLIRSQV